MKKKFFIVVGVIVAIAVGVFVYMNKADNKQEAINIGAILPLTGDAAAYGVSARQGIETALALDYKANPRDVRIVVMYEDTQADPRIGVSAANKLITVNNVKAIIGGMASSVTLAVAPIAEKNRIILISPGSSAPAITDAGNYILRTAYSDTFEGQILGRFAATDAGLKTFGILHTDNAYGVGLSKEFSKIFEDIGGKVLSSRTFREGETDFKMPLTAIRNESPEGLLIIGYKELGRIVRQVRELGIESQILSSVMFEDPEVIALAGNAADGAFYAYPAYNPQGDTSSAVRIFVETYQSMYGKEPDIYAALAYDAAALVLLAIRTVGNDADKIKSFLYAVEGFNGATGKMRFDENGDVVKEHGIKRVKDGQFVWYRERF